MVFEKNCENTPRIPLGPAEVSATLEESLQNIMQNSPNISYRIFAEALLLALHQSNLNAIAIDKLQNKNKKKKNGQ